MVRGITGMARVVSPLIPEVVPVAEAVLHGVGQPFFLQRQQLVVLVLPGTGLVVPVNLQGVHRVLQVVIPPVHINTVALRVLTGMAVNV